MCSKIAWNNINKECRLWHCDKCKCRNQSKNPVYLTTIPLDKFIGKWSVRVGTFWQLDNLGLTDKGHIDLVNGWCFKWPSGRLHVYDVQYLKDTNLFNFLKFFRNETITWKLKPKKLPVNKMLFWRLTGFSGSVLTGFASDTWFCFAFECLWWTIYLFLFVEI